MFARVGNQSMQAKISSVTVPAGTLPGQRTIAGARNPPKSGKVILRLSRLLKRIADLIRNLHQAETVGIPDLADDIGEQLDSITLAVKQMTATLDEVLMITKSEAGKVAFTPTLVDVSRLCRDIVEKWDAMSTADHTITFNNH